jgi:hypothetical protein
MVRILIPYILYRTTISGTYVSFNLLSIKEFRMIYYTEIVSIDLEDSHKVLSSIFFHKYYTNPFGPHATICLNMRRRKVVVDLEVGRQISNLIDKERKFGTDKLELTN